MSVGQLAVSWEAGEVRLITSWRCCSEKGVNAVSDSSRMFRLTDPPCRLLASSKTANALRQRIETSSATKTMQNPFPCQLDGEKERNAVT